jgi:hypothetical protein
MDDASLDEFLDDADSGDGADAAEDAPGATVESADPAVDPATTTYAWSASAVTCDACGTDTDRRWHDGDGRLVCPDCKDW